MDASNWDDSYASNEPLPWDTGTPDPHLVALWEAGRLRRGRALDIGCGTGTNAIWLARQGFDVLGVDVAPHALSRARAHQQQAGVTCRFEVADFLRDVLGEKPFDLVFDRGCFHVFEAADREAFARQVARVLAPDGLWVSLIGSTEGGPRGMGPPRRSARDVVQAIEPALQILELRAAEFEATAFVPRAAAWLCLSGPRIAPAEPSSRH